MENKVPNTSGLVEKLNHNAKVTEMENKTASISGLATNTALTAVESKIPNISSLVKNNNYNTKITETEKELAHHNHNNHITTPEFHKLLAEVFDARSARENLVTKTDFDDKLRSPNQKINSDKTKDLLVEKELKTLKTFDSSYFRGKSYFEEYGIQNYLVFQQCTDILKDLVMLVKVIIFIFGNLKNCLVEILQLLIRVIIASLRN